MNLITIKGLVNGENTDIATLMVLHMEGKKLVKVNILNW